MNARKAKHIRKASLPLLDIIDLVFTHFFFFFPIRAPDKNWHLVSLSGFQSAASVPSVAPQNVQPLYMRCPSQMPGLKLGAQWTTPFRTVLNQNVLGTLLKFLTLISKAERKKEQFIQDHKKI